MGSYRMKVGIDYTVMKKYLDTSQHTKLRKNYFMPKTPFKYHLV